MTVPNAGSVVRKAGIGGALVLALAGGSSPSRQLLPGAGMHEDTPDAFVMPTALVMDGRRRDRGGDSGAALERYRRALILARRLYGDAHPNTAFVHAALGVWHARFGRPEDAREHLRESQHIEDARGGIFVNIAETRLPADGSDPLGKALTRLRLQRDLVLCALDGGCSPARVLGLSDALAAMDQ